jgi:hypothetical protein
VVQHPQWVNTLDFRVGTLLPIQPPEITSFVFQWVVQLFEVFGKELLVGTFEWNRLEVSFTSFTKHSRRGNVQHPWRNPGREPCTWLHKVSRMLEHHLQGGC